MPFVITHLASFSLADHRLLPLSLYNSETLVCFSQERTAGGAQGVI